MALGCETSGAALTRLLEPTPAFIAFLLRSSLPLRSAPLLSSPPLHLRIPHSALIALLLAPWPTLLTSLTFSHLFPSSANPSPPRSQIPINTSQDLVFNFYKVYAILDEVFLAGEIEETSKSVILDRLEFLEKLE